VDSGPYPPGEVADRLQVGLVATLPVDTKTARSLSFGGSVHRRRPLVRAAVAAHALMARGREVANAVRAG